MNALIKKEIRLLLPSWGAVLGLETVLPWFWKDPDMAISSAPFFFFFGVILLAVDAFGREFSAGTFQSLLAQPMARSQIWRTKITTLLLAGGLVFAAYFVSCALRLHLAVADVNSTWHLNPANIGSDFRNAMLGSFVAMLVALVGGLWTTLLFRQISAAFWITFLTPAGLLLLIAFVMTKFFDSASDAVDYSVLFGAAAIYCSSGFWLAHRLFHRAQDVAWTGGVISFSKWRYLDTGAKASISLRQRRPLGALLKKEFQLHSISLFGAAALLGLHLMVILIRLAYGSAQRDSLTSLVLESYPLLWLVMPIIVGCMAVAEERKLNVTEAQFCLPVSRRTQFALKFFPTLIIGSLLGGVLPLLLEIVAGYCGAACSMFKPEALIINTFGIPGIVWYFGACIGLAAGFTLISFFASSLAKNFLQALSIGIVAVVVGILFYSFINQGMFVEKGQFSVWGRTLWGVFLPPIIGLLTACFFIPCLAYRNYRNFVEGNRLWRRNILGLLGALLFVFGVSAALYNRVWEVVEPAEPPHGPAVFSAANPPKLGTDNYTGLKVQFPDGRIWFGSLGYPHIDDHNFGTWKYLLTMIVHPFPVSTGPQEFMAGSNWLSATTRHMQFRDHDNGNAVRQVNGYLDTIGVQANGSLWISSEAKPLAWTSAKLEQFGAETNWQKVIQHHVCPLLLKTDGTLWQWGTNRIDNKQWQTHWPTVRATQPKQIGTNSDWQEFSGQRFCPFARRTDGSVWRINDKWITERATNFDQVNFQTLSASGNNDFAYIGKDGTLWANGPQHDAHAFLQMGSDTNWVAVAMNWNWLVALKSDGSLWQWRLGKTAAPETAQMAPTRLGIHSDWIGIVSTWSGTVTLATDGTLWLWPAPTGYNQFVMRNPKQPQPLGNIFGKAD